MSDGSGSVLAGRYRLEARLGAGGMAEVFRGFDPVLNRTVAIKILNAQFARDAGFVARFRREAQAAARLNHPSIVGVYDSGADGDTQFIVMEFVEGRTLAEVLAAGRHPTPMQSVELAQRIATPLGIAHAEGIVHRDIKPANVMVTRDGQVKVMDFGIARIQTVETAPQTSSVLGTPTYLSPEQAQGQQVDSRSDLYSLGVVLYELLAGRPPFTGDSPVAIAYKQVNEAPVQPSTLNPDVPPRLDAVVMKALSKNPANRYQSAAEFTADLERVKKGQEVEATPLLPASEATQVIARPQATQVMPPQAEPEGSSRKVWLGVLIGVLIVAVLGGGGYLLASSLQNKNEGDTFSMPSVKTLPFEQAKAQLEDLGLVVLDPKKEQTDASKPNTVLAQTPSPDDLVKPGDEVLLTIAVAVPTVAVPDLTCMTLAEAQLALTNLGLGGLGDKGTTTSDACPPDTIVEQTPLPDTQVPKAATTLIDVTLVAAPTTVVLPNLTCLPYGKANSQLAKLGLVATLGATAPLRPECPNTNFVAAQDPVEGDVVPIGSTVTLSLGAEPSPTPTPTLSPTPTGSPTP